MLLQESAEFGRIGKYYATESMLVWDDKKQVHILSSFATQPALFCRRQGTEVNV